jgi:hypothetical protein
MAGVDPAIHEKRLVDPRDKPGDDELSSVLIAPLMRGCAREKEIRIKSLIFLDSVFREQVITGQ